MNQYSELLEYIKQTAEQGDYINTVLQGDTGETDKGVIYPLLQISIDNGSFTNTQSVIFDVVLECVSERDTNKQDILEDRFWRQDNEIDNHNETHAELNRIWSIMYRNFNDNNITASENPTLEKIIGERGAILDGWALTFQVEMPNNTLSLCT